MVECVMNVSEGRCQQTLSAIGGMIESTRGAFLLDVHQDWDHHRAVFSFMGDPSSVLGAAFSVISEAVKRIDLRCHRGVHPRSGAVDVVPFVPLQGISTEECVKRVHRFAREVARALEIPVYLYEKAALRAGWENLPQIRRKRLEQFRQSGGDDVTLHPDFGPVRPHPSAGVTIMGVRRHLIAFNVFLDSKDVSAARRIAAWVRESGGGLVGVRALGFFLSKRGQAQVSMNLTDYRKSPLVKVFKCVRQEAHRLGLAVTSSEIVGLAPRAALGEGGPEILRLENQDSCILEDRIREVLQGQEYSERMFS